MWVCMPYLWRGRCQWHAWPTPRSAWPPSSGTWPRPDSSKTLSTKETRHPIIIRVPILSLYEYQDVNEKLYPFKFVWHLISSNHSSFGFHTADREGLGRSREGEMPKKWVGRGRRGLSLYRAGRPREGGPDELQVRKSTVPASTKKKINVKGSYFIPPPPPG